jgi:hypothetical protein
MVVVTVDGHCGLTQHRASPPAAMYEDSWYSQFVPRAAKPVEKGKHRRRESLLKQPTVSPPSAPRVRGDQY